MIPADRPDPSAPGGGGAPRWGLGDAVLGYAVGTVLSLIGLIFTLDTSSSGDELNAAAAIASTLGLALGLGGIAIWASGRKGSGSLAVDFGLRVTPRDLGFGALVGAACQFLVVPLIYVPISWFADVDELEEPARELADTAQTAPAVVALGIALVLIAPVVEELFFRGLVLRSLLRRSGAQGRAVVVSALVFAAAHFQVLQFPALLVFGLVLGALAVRRGRLGAAIGAHMVFNAVTFVALLAER